MPKPLTLFKHLKFFPRESMKLWSNISLLFGHFPKRNQVAVKKYDGLDHPIDLSIHSTKRRFSCTPCSIKAIGINVFEFRSNCMKGRSKNNMAPKLSRHAILTNRHSGSLAVRRGRLRQNKQCPDKTCFAHNPVLSLPCCALIFLRAYPAEPSFFCTLTPYSLRSTEYPAVLTLL